MSGEWKRCSTCKKSIGFGATYYVCSVSTCTRKRTGMFFCSVECWESHLPMMRHREAWAVEETAPTFAEHEAEHGRSPTPRGAAPAASRSAPPRPSTPQRRTPESPQRRRIQVGGQGQPAEDVPREVLVVVSRFKNYVKERWGLNTSDGVFDALSDHLRKVAGQAIDHARLDGRKTLLDRDFDFLRK